MHKVWSIIHDGGSLCRRTTEQEKEWQSTPASVTLGTLPFGRVQRQESLPGKVPGARGGLAGILSAGVFWLFASIAARSRLT